MSIGSAFLFGTTVTLIQLSGAYLRYLPFSREMTAGEMLILRNRFLIWSVISLSLNSTLAMSGVDTKIYTIMFSLGWIPYIIISMTVIRNQVLQHIFVCGMQGLWNFMLQSLSAMTIAIIYGGVMAKHLQLHMAIALVFFAVLLPVERKIFVNLLPSKKFFEMPVLKWYVAFLPIVVFLGTVAPIAKTGFMITWQGRLSRLIVPFFFFIMYRSLSISTKTLEDEQKREKNARIMRQQFQSLREHNFLMKKNKKEVENLRDNLSKSYRVIERLLNEGNVNAAMSYIREQDELLDSTVVKKFCDSPLINAALSMYFRRAEEIGVKVNQKINLPDNLATAENDLAVLLSNLIENAVQASEKQPMSRREISVTFQHIEDQCALEVSNLYDFPVKLGEDNLPCTEREGHGLGMTSLENFVKKYNAHLNFSQEGGRVVFSMHWED